MVQSAAGRYPRHHGNFAVADLPTEADGVVAGDIAYATDGRKAAEGAGSGTGVLVFRDAQETPIWARVDTGAEVAA